MTQTTWSSPQPTARMVSGLNNHAKYLKVGTFHTQAVEHNILHKDFLRPPKIIKFNILTANYQEITLEKSISLGEDNQLEFYLKTIYCPD